jgi:histidyl-tRNA synthetase
MANKEIFQVPVGTKDVLGEEARSWVTLISKFSKIAHLYNYDLAITPTFENYEVFARLGEDTDIVSKEMYDFRDKGERHIALKPEGTAGIVRAVAQSRPVMPFKAWYFTSVFRYERPQKGRLREHHQLGIEAFGIEDPLVDVEVIEFANEFLKSAGLRDYKLLINSLGDSDARSKHLEALKSYFSKFEKSLGDEFSERVARNPFRVLDTKVPEWLEVVEDAPQILDYISDESRADFDFVCSNLSELGIEYEVVPKLVRGLDYYTNTTFEFVSQSLDAAQSTVAGGGRYNKLVAQMGGPETPGIGFGLGIERLLLALESENVKVESRKLDAIVLDFVQNENSRTLCHKIRKLLRNENYSLENAFGAKSMKSSFKMADRSRAKYAIIVGEAELANGVVSLKNMESGEQSEVSMEQLVENMKK